MPRRLRFGSVTGDALQSLDAQLGTGNENGNNPDNDLVARDSNGNIVLRYDESVGDWVFDSITTEGLSNGVAGDGNTINDVHGDTGEIDVIGMVPYMPGEEPTFTSDTFVELGGSVNRSRLEETGQGSFYGMTNRDGPVQGKVCGFVPGASDQDVTIRLTDQTDTETVVSPGETFATPWGTPTANSVYVEGRLETQTGSDEASVAELLMIFGIEVGQ